MPKLNLVIACPLWLQIHMWLALRKYWEIVLILSSSQGHCAAMDLKRRTSKISSFFSLIYIESQKELSRFHLFSWVTINGYKNWIFFYNNKKSYAPIKELTTHLLKNKYFYNQIKIIYPLWGLQPKLENNNQRAYHNYNQSIQIYWYI